MESDIESIKNEILKKNLSIQNVLKVTKEKQLKIKFILLFMLYYCLNILIFYAFHLRESKNQV